MTTNKIKLKNKTVYCRDDTPDSDDSAILSKNNGYHDRKSEISTLSSASNSSAAININSNPLVSPSANQKYDLNSLPKYIFDSDHSQLKSVETILKKISLETFDDSGEVSEYPIEIFENQEHEIQRSISVR